MSCNSIGLRRDARLIGITQARDVVFYNSFVAICLGRDAPEIRTIVINVTSILTVASLVSPNFATIESLVESLQAYRVDVDVKEERAASSSAGYAGESLTYNTQQYSCRSGFPA